MKDVKKIIYTALAVCLVLCGCKNKDDVNSLFKEVVVNRNMALTDAPHSPVCTIDIQVKYLDEKSKRAERINNTIEQQIFNLQQLSMQQAVDAFVKQYTDSYRENMMPLYRDDQHDTERQGWYEYQYKLGTTVTPGLNDAIVYRAELMTYEGGAHPNHQTMVMNFDADSGQLLKLNDIFVTGYEQPLCDMLLSELMRKTNSKNMDELHDKGYLMTMDLYVPDNYILGTNDVTFHYNPYEIAPYATGDTELTISYGQLKAIMKKQ